MPDKTFKPRGHDPKFSGPKLRGDCRRIKIGDQLWQFNTDHDRVVTLYSPDDTRTNVAMHAFYGYDAREAYEANIDAHFDPDISNSPEVTPGEVRAYLERTGMVVAEPA